MQFRWNDWNREHIGEHGVDPDEAEMLIRHAKAPFPQRIDDDKMLVMGRAKVAASCKPSLYWTRMTSCS
jgi:hypothetical protein